MATISENLQILKDSTDAIKQAIIDKGGTIEGDISTWADAISAIQAGGSSSGAGSVFKITNKLNGQFFGGPNYGGVRLEETLHTYAFEGGELDSMALILVNSYNTFSTVGPMFYNYVYIDHGSNSSYYQIDSSSLIVGAFTLLIHQDGSLIIKTNGGSTSQKPAHLALVVFDKDSNYDIDFFSVQAAGPCLLKDTIITLADNTTKLIQDINYNDELKVWNFDEGMYSSAKPLWIMKGQQSLYYYHIIFEDGRELKLMGSDGKCHRVFSVTKNRFEYAVDCVGDEVFTENGITRMMSCERVEEECEYYNIITHYHLNMFTNGILTSCRYNNIYPIRNMKFVKDNRLEREPRWKVYADKFRAYPELTSSYLDGLRLYEQNDISIEDTVAYVNRLETLKKKLEDFEENKEIETDIDNTNVGWIDPEGNVYGYRLYMPGQMNHITLADKIGEKLGLEKEEIGGYSRTLEKLGWTKYTNTFLSYGSDKEITRKQEQELFKFLHHNEHVKKRGVIKMGNIFAYDDKIDYLDMMPRRDFTKKMRG